jgi:ribosomal protein S18 acetylase RimI-like enzyme
VSVLERIEGYYDEVPRASADVEELGSLRLFVSRAPWPYYGRPSGRDGDHGSDLARLVARQRELDIPVALEWVDEVTPWLAAAAAGAALQVERYPLLVLEAPRPAPAIEGVNVRIADADDPAIPAARAAIHRAFGSEGGGGDAEYAREQIRKGLSVMAIADTPEGPVGGGIANPRQDTAELVGIGVLPEHRRRGIGQAITATLTDELARRGVTTVFLSAGSDSIARIYERAGFKRLATACIASGPIP